MALAAFVRGMLREAHSTTVRLMAGLLMRTLRIWPCSISANTGATGKIVAPMPAMIADFRIAIELISMTLPITSPAARAMASMRGRTPCCRPGRISVVFSACCSATVSLSVNQTASWGQMNRTSSSDRWVVENGVSWPSSNSTARLTRPLFSCSARLPVSSSVNCSVMSGYCSRAAVSKGRARAPEMLCGRPMVTLPDGRADWVTAERASATCFRMACAWS